MYSGWSSTILIGIIISRINQNRNAVKPQKTKKGNFTTYQKVKVYLWLLEFIVTIIMTWGCHAYDYADSGYYMATYSLLGYIQPRLFIPF